jgi:hypothetical protein
MIKKLTLLGICILGLLLPTWSQEGPAIIEYLAWATTGSSMPWELRPPDPTVQINFASPILLSFNVPPSPKSPAIYLELWAQYILNWTSNPFRTCTALIYFRIISPAIPNIEFSQAYGVPPNISETNYAGNQTYPTNAMPRHKGYCKMALRRGFLEWWWIVDKNTGERPADDLALSYINSIIDNGFRVEVWAGGTIQGLSYIAPFAFQVEVTRLSNKK